MPKLTIDQREVAARLIASVVRDALDQKRKPSLREVEGRATTAAAAYVAGVRQVSRAASPVAPHRRVSK